MTANQPNVQITINSNETDHTTSPSSSLSSSRNEYPLANATLPSYLLAHLSSSSAIKYEHEQVKKKRYNLLSNDKTNIISYKR
jgi:hypothetical protein